MKIKTTYPIIVNNKVVASSQTYEGGFLNAEGEGLFHNIGKKTAGLFKGKKNKKGISESDSSTTQTETNTAPDHQSLLTTAERNAIVDEISLLGKDRVIYSIYKVRQSVANNSASTPGINLQDAKEALGVLNAYAQEVGWTDSYINSIAAEYEAKEGKQTAENNYQQSFNIYNKIKTYRQTISALSVFSFIAAATAIYLLVKKSKHESNSK